MKKIHLALLDGLIILGLLHASQLPGQTISTPTWSKNEATNWLNSRAWANGLKLTVFEGVNSLEFAKQYHKNKDLWDKAFVYLREINLDTISPGKYFIYGDKVFAIVSDVKPKSFEETKFEAHRKYIDIQYVIRGKEKMGIAPFSKTTVLDEYNEAKDIGFYNCPDSNCKYYIAEPGTLLLFFPQDAHRPGINVEGINSVKKIVIKVKAD